MSIHSIIGAQLPFEGTIWVYHNGNAAFIISKPLRIDTYMGIYEPMQKQQVHDPKTSSGKGPMNSPCKAPKQQSPPGHLLTEKLLRSVH